MVSILLADDDEELCDLLQDYLNGEGFMTTCVNDGRAALEAALRSDHEILVLDVMMPGLNGFDVLRELRTRSVQLPVLMLTARGEEVDRIVGLELGADDYLPKPFNPRELVARLRAILRRGTLPGTGAVLRVGDVELRTGDRSVRRGDQPVELTGAEFSVLEVLLRAAGQVIARDALSEQALGRPLGRYDRSLDMHVSNLRKKLGPGPDGGPRIRAVRGQGYLYPHG